MSDETRGLYLALLKKCLLNTIYDEHDYTNYSVESRLKGMVGSLFRSQGVELLRKTDPAKRSGGRDYPAIAHSMIGMKRLDNLQFCIEDVIERKIPGDLIETGVWRGGACIFMRGVLKAHGLTDRKVWVADSFEGLPVPRYEVDQRDPEGAGNLHTNKALAISLDQVKANFSKYGLLDDQVQFLKGWFRDSLPKAPIQQLAVLRLDGDLYESTLDALAHLYPKLAVGGYLIVDDYFMAVCKKAVQEYREKNGINEEIKPIDDLAVYWRRAKL